MTVRGFGERSGNVARRVKSTLTVWEHETHFLCTLTHYRTVENLESETNGLVHAMFVGIGLSRMVGS